MLWALSTNAYLCHAMPCYHHAQADVGLGSDARRLIRGMLLLQPGAGAASVRSSTTSLDMSAVAASGAGGNNSSTGSSPQTLRQRLVMTGGAEDGGDPPGVDLDLTPRRSIKSLSALLARGSNRLPPPPAALVSSSSMAAVPAFPAPSAQGGASRLSASPVASPGREQAPPGGSPGRRSAFSQVGGLVRQSSSRSSSPMVQRNISFAAAGSDTNSGRGTWHGPKPSAHGGGSDRRSGSHSSSAAPHSPRDTQPGAPAADGAGNGKAGAAPPLVVSDVHWATRLSDQHTPGKVGRHSRNASEVQDQAAVDGGASGARPGRVAAPPVARTPAGRATGGSGTPAAQGGSPAAPSRSSKGGGWIRGVLHTCLVAVVVLATAGIYHSVSDVRSSSTVHQDAATATSHTSAEWPTWAVWPARLQSAPQSQPTWCNR